MDEILPETTAAVDKVDMFVLSVLDLLKCWINDSLIDSFPLMELPDIL